jgi:hypothetical protein
VLDVHSPHPTSHQFFSRFAYSVISWVTGELKLYSVVNELLVYRPKNVYQFFVGFWGFDNVSQLPISIVLIVVHQFVLNETFRVFHF